MRTTPSISGASAAERPIATPSATSSTSTVSVRPTLRGEPRCADARLRRHEARAPVFSDVGGNRVGQRIRCRAIDRRVREAADAVEIRRVEEREQFVEFGVGLARESQR